MPRQADTRPRTRSPRSSSWLTSSLLLVGLAVAGVYGVWGDAPFKKTWTQLGFGNQSASDSFNRHVADAVPRVDAVEAMEFPVPDSSDDRIERAAASSEEESAASNFLPRSRDFGRANNRQVPVVEEAANADLDRRFDSDALTEKLVSIRTAVFADPGREREPGVSRAGQESDRSDRLPTIKVEPRQPTGQDSAGSSNSNAPSKASRIQLAAGEDEEPLLEIAKPAARPKVKASPTTVNAGVGRLNLNEINALIEQGQDAEAYLKLSDAFFQFPSQRQLFQIQLDEVAQRIYFSPQTQIQPPYEIQPGDQLRKIASKYQISWQYLSRLNQVDAKKIRPGKMLKVFQGPFKATVDLSDFQLTVFLNGQFVKRYAVGIGKMNSTPIGEFNVREKLENPTYFGPNGLVQESDDPQNPLGERWIDIGNSFGIHGTIDPDSIGKSESAGCIRMLNADVAEVYDLLTVGSKVRIQR